MKRKLLITVLFALLIPAASWGQSLDGFCGVKFGSDFNLLDYVLTTKGFEFYREDIDEDVRFETYTGRFDIFGYQIIMLSCGFNDNGFVSYQAMITDDFSHNATESLSFVITGYMNLFDLFPIDLHHCLNLDSGVSVDFYITEDAAMGTYLVMRVVDTNLE